MSIRKRLYDILEVSKKRGDLSWFVDLFIMSLIGLNVMMIILESVPAIRAEYGKEFHRFEVFSVVVFTAEYILRVLTANEAKAYRTPVIGNLKYMLTPLAIIDLLAILPFFLPYAGLDLRVLRILRIFRMFRLFKFARYIKALSLIDKVVKEKREALTISLMLTVFLLLITSSVMYYIENPAQPDKFTSIPQTMWWGIATLTTVGYGDIYPVTGLGQFLGGIIAIIGVGLFALPAGILASGFSEHLGKDDDEEAESNGSHCPKCGQLLIEHSNTNSDKIHGNVKENPGK